jgi:Tol biopolymer transport system component
MTLGHAVATGQRAGRVRKALPAAVVVVALTVAGAACGGSGRHSASPRTASTANSATKAAGATSPRRNGTIVFRRFLRPDRTHGAIFTIAPDGTGERQVSKPDAGFGDDFPDFAANGSLIAFQRCNDAGDPPCRIFTVRPDGTGLRAVGGCQGDELPPRCASSSYPALAPDGRRIAFVRTFGRFRDGEFEHQGIYTMRIDGSHVRRVSLPRTRAAIDDNPQWSPEGRRIVFVRTNLTANPAGKTALFIVRADGSGRRRLTPWTLDAGDGPVWSPDGSRILFRSPASEDFLDSNLYTIRPDGSGLEQVTDVSGTTRVYSSSFSPDGGSIAFGMTGVGDAADVYTIHLDGTALKPVTRTVLHDSAPDWGGSQ